MCPVNSEKRGKGKGGGKFPLLVTRRERREEEEKGKNGSFFLSIRKGNEPIN